MRLHSILLFLLLLTATTTSAITITGTIRNQRKQPIPGANVFIKDSYDGGTSDATGQYSFTTDLTGEAILLCNYIGFESFEQTITLNGSSITVDVVLNEKVSELNTVVISAGTIEASDEKRTTVLKPLDIVTTAGSAGDIFGALQTLPGTQRVGDQEGLFVRGGAGTEAKTIIDGMIVNNPFFTGIQDVAARGRFSPFLFKGTVFSTGGYSAQYGQALSSVLVLETQDLPDRTASTLALSSVGIGAGHNHLWEKKGFSLGGDFNYTNLKPYFTLVPQLQKFTRGPEFIGGSANFRKKIGDTGILKFYGYFNLSDLAFPLVDINDTTGGGQPFSLKNRNIYTNLSWRQYVGDWRFDAAASYSHNRDQLNVYSYLFNARSNIRNTANLSQGRAMASRGFMQRNMLRVGAEYQYAFDEVTINTTNQSLPDNYTSGFVESDIFFSQKIVARIGARAENSSLLNSTRLAPRLSLAAKTGANSQFSVAYGDFYQKPLRDYLLNSPTLHHEKATHYILSFQQVTDSITFRIEGYYKTYNQLTKREQGNPALGYANTGTGFARGFDVFWRDKKTFRNVDYWISYTFLDAERDYLDYSTPAQPTFATKHNASLVFKKFFPRIMTSVGFSYFYASGRPYFNPNNPEFLGDKTYDYHSLNINASYLTRVFGAFTVIAVSVTNVTGFEQVFTYRYSIDGTRRQAVGPPAPRSFFIGMFMSFGQDRSREVINNNN